MNLRIKSKIAQAKKEYELYCCLSCKKKTVECLNKKAAPLSNERYMRKCFNQSCELYGIFQQYSNASHNSMFKLPTAIAARIADEESRRQLEYGPNKTQSIAHVTPDERNLAYNEIMELFNGK